MDPFAVSHFSDRALLHDLKSLVAQDRRTTAVMLTRIAEVDERELFLREGYPSMHAYCVHELHLSEYAAHKRINVARMVRQFPAALVALADGRVHMTAVLMLAPHLTSGNADELVAAATHKTRFELEELIARRFPRPDLPERLQAIPSPPSPIPGVPPSGLAGQLAAQRVASTIPEQSPHGPAEALPKPARELAAERVEAPTPDHGIPGQAGLLPQPARELAPQRVEAPTPDHGIPGQAGALLQPAPELASQRVEATIPDQDPYGHVEAFPRPTRELAPQRVDAAAPRPRMTPLAPERFGLQVTIDQETHDLLRQAQALMSHQLPTGEIAPVLKSALRLLVSHLEQRKYAATTRPGPSRPCTSARHIPAAVKRTVWERDGGRCSFVSDSGQRCRARASLEFDHIEPVARGGRATAENVRIVCRAHNQHVAERAFGAEFMDRKRTEVRRAGRSEGGVMRSRSCCLPPGS